MIVSSSNEKFSKLLKIRIDDEEGWNGKEYAHMSS